MLSPALESQHCWIPSSKLVLSASSEFELPANMFKLQIPGDFGEEPWSIATLAIADAIAWYGHTQMDGALDTSSLFLFYFACCSWLTVGIVCKLILKYGFN